MVDLELATFMPLRKEQLPTAIEAYGQLLQHLRCAAVDKVLPRDVIQWQPDGSGFGFMGEPIPLHVNSSREQAVTARPHLSGFDDTLPGTETTPWFSAAFVFESASDAYGASGNTLTAKYTPDFGDAVLTVAQWLVSEFESEFLTIGAYFSSYVVVLEPWQYLLGIGGNLWAFDLAVVPQRLSAQFQEMPTRYTFQECGTTLCLANSGAWARLPWTKSP